MGRQVHVGVALAHVEAFVLSGDSHGAILYHTADQDQEVDKVGGEADYTDVLEDKVEDVAQVNGAQVAQHRKVHLTNKGKTQ